MTQVEILDAARDHAAGFKVDANRGERIGLVASVSDKGVEYLALIIDSTPQIHRYICLPAIERMGDVWREGRRRLDRNA